VISYSEDIMELMYLLITLTVQGRAMLIKNFTRRLLLLFRKTIEPFQLYQEIIKVFDLDLGAISYFSTFHKPSSCVIFHSAQIS
jgi:hypothetical protein